MYCTGCGNALAADAAFCTKCGTKAPVAGQMAAAEAPPQDTAEVVQSAEPAPVVPALAAAPARRASGRLALWIVGGVVLITVAGVAASQIGLFGGIVKEESASSAGGRGKKSEDAKATGASAETAEDAAPAGGAPLQDGELPAGHPAIGGTALTAAESYDLLAAHYATLWDLHEKIGIQDEGEYTGTGFVFEPGGFNDSIGHTDKAVREELVERCRDLMAQVMAERDKLTSTVVDPAYESQQATLFGLYGALMMRVESMYDAAGAAVDNPAREDGWGDKLQPRSKDGRQRFESDYPGAKPKKL